MDYPLYNPERPQMTGPCMGNRDAGNCDSHKPPLPPIAPPVGGPCGINPNIPQIQPVPPVPSPIEGTSLYESMNALTQRVNTCINQWNQIQANCYEALNQVVGAARANDVYYTHDEVSYQEGFDQIEGAAYAIVEKKALDRKKEPIFVRLYPAYNNTSNPGVNQKIFDASFITTSNVIITAVQAGATTWGGPALKNGAGIPGTEQEDGYVYGFNRRGGLRYFPSNVSETTLCQQGMVDVIGGCLPILYDGQLLDGIEEKTEKEAITAIGFNAGTGSVFFFSCSAQNEPGISVAGCARILQEYGCTVAVVTSHTVNTSNATASEGMLYMGQMTTDPVQAIQPDNVAYWIVSKQPCFRNDFQKAIGDLVQTTGRNQWETYLLGVQIQSFDQRIKDNAANIAAEVERAMQAENWLQENINKEVNRAMQAEAWLQENINKEVERATNAEEVLQNNIDAETDRATEAETALNEKIDAETDRAKAAEADLKNAINDEYLRAVNREREIQDALDQEITKRINADNDIINSIEQEILARRAADTELRTLIEQVQSEAKGDIAVIQTQIDNILNGQISLPYLKLTGGTMSGPVTFASGQTITLGRGPTLSMEAATKKYVDDLFATGGGGGTGGDVSKEYVDEQVENLQNQLDEKVSKTGDTMSGNLNMDGNKIIDPVLTSASPIAIESADGAPGTITNLANPTSDTDATNKEYVDTSIQTAIDSAKAELADEYLPLAGGSMTGDINMTGRSVIKFQDATTQSTLSMRAAVEPQSEMGSVYNDDSAMVVKSETGSVNLIGTEVNVSDGAGGSVGIYGVNEVQLKPGDPTSTRLSLNTSTIQANAQTLQVVNNGLITGTIEGGGISLYDETNTLEVSIARHNGHLDINVEDDKGSVYINRMGTAGGTGEVWLTEVHSPQQLLLSPATSISATNHNIRNLKAGELDLDAVNVSQLNKVKDSIGGALGAPTVSVNGSTVTLTSIVGTSKSFDVKFQIAAIGAQTTNVVDSSVVNGYIKFTLNSVLNSTLAVTLTVTGTTGALQFRGFPAYYRVIAGPAPMPSGGIGDSSSASQTFLYSDTIYSAQPASTHIDWEFYIPIQPNWPAYS